MFHKVLTIMLFVCMMAYSLFTVCMFQCVFKVICTSEQQVCLCVCQTAYLHIPELSASLIFFLTPLILCGCYCTLCFYMCSFNEYLCACVCVGVLFAASWRQSHLWRRQADGAGPRPVSPSPVVAYLSAADGSTLRWRVETLITVLVRLLRGGDGCLVSVRDVCVSACVYTCLCFCVYYFEFVCLWLSAFFVFAALRLYVCAYMHLSLCLRVCVWVHVQNYALYRWTKDHFTLYCAANLTKSTIKKCL